MTEVDHRDSPRRARTLRQPKSFLTSFLRLRLWANRGPTASSGVFSTLLHNSRPRVPCRDVMSLGSSSIPCSHHKKWSFVGTGARVQGGRHDMGPAPSVPEYRQKLAKRAQPRALGKRMRGSMHLLSVQSTPRRTI
jgi:hypothetical protein